MSIELRRSRRRRAAHLRRLRNRRRSRPPYSREADRATEEVAASLAALPTRWGPSPRGWLLEALGFHGLDAVEEGLLVALVSGEPALLVGRHGTAKTAVCCALGEVLGLSFHAYDAAKALFEDVVGFPNPTSLSQGEVSYVPTPMSMWDKEFVLVDELSRAQPQMQNKWLEVIRSHRLMGRPLPRLRYVLAAMNPTYYLGAVPLDEALLSRFAVVLEVPDVIDMGEEVARRVITARSADDAPLLADRLSGGADEADLPRLRRRLRRRLTVARRQLPAVEAMFGDAVVSYVHEVALHLAERGHAQDARRLGMMRRNLLVALALRAGERRLDEARAAPGMPAALEAFGIAADELASLVGRVLVVSLPFAASGRPGPSAEILGTIHRACFEQTFFEADAVDASPAGGKPLNPTAGHRRQLLAYRQTIHDLPLEEHYRVVNEHLQRVQEALSDRLLTATQGLVELGDLIRDHAADVPWEVTEQLVDGIAARFGVSETPAPVLVLLFSERKVDPQRPEHARLARMSLAHVRLKEAGDEDEAGPLLERFLEQRGAR